MNHLSTFKMAPSKSKKGCDDSPEERRSKRKRQNDDDEEEEREKEPISKASTSKKTPAFTGGSSHKPAELFRKDLISAMKLADSEQLAPEDYILIADAWRQEWERGVQVPVNEISIPKVDLRQVSDLSKEAGDFKIPKKFLHAMKDETYQLGMHELTGMSQLAEQVVRYDLDDLDVCWLRELNDQREEIGEEKVHEWTMERVVEALENQCHENMETKKKTEEGLGIEYDEDIVCEICQSPDSEDSNEMVFCDGCDICVHQACYGIQTVPEGSWLCRTCALGIKPQCILCPKSGGAMKSTRSGTKWAHVSCAIWIPEVTIGCVEKMEPITKISQIPASRWALCCVVCKERCGACIQCSVKSCKTAFHVTCAITDKLEMKTVLVEEKNTEDVKLKAYCPKHSKKRDRNGSESDTDSPRKSNCGSPAKEREMSEEEKATLRAERLHKLEDEFYTLIRTSEIATQLDVPEEVVDLIYVFWKLKRRSLFNRPLLTPKTEEADLLERQQEDSLVARMKMFVHLRQDLERVRNLSYMIGKREKIKRQFARSRESVFYAALEVLTDKDLNLSTRDVLKIVKQYKELPAPYNGMAVKKTKTTAVDIKSESSSSKTKKSAVDDKDWETSSVCSTQSSASKATSGNLDGAKTEKKRKISETPKSRKSRVKHNSGESTKAETMIKVEKLDVSGQEEMDASIDVTGEIKTELASAMENESQGVKSPTRSSGRNKSRSLQHDKIDTDTESVRASSDSDSERNVPSGRKRRTRSSLPEPSFTAESIKDEIASRLSLPGDRQAKRETKPTDSERKRERRPSAATVKISEEEKQELVESVPSAKNVSDHVKAEINTYLKNNKLIVSKKLRHKVQNSLLSNKRRGHFSNGVIIDHTQRKIDNFFAKSPPMCESLSHKSPAKAVSRVLNELSPTRDRFEANNIERTNNLRASMRGNDTCLRTTPTRCSPLLSERQKSVEKCYGSKEGSPDIRPTKRRLDNSSSITGSEKLYDSSERKMTHSRESTPDSVGSSVRSLKCDESIRTRSNTPTLVNKDSDESESENMCKDNKRRRTKSQHLEMSGRREGSRSPQNLHRSRVKSVVT